jgi:hypothetical protein
MRANLLAKAVVEVAIALWTLQQITAWSPKPLITYALGEDAAPLVVAAAGARVLSCNLEYPPEKRALEIKRK